MSNLTLKHSAIRSVLWIGRNTFLEAVRQKFFGFLIVITLLMIFTSIGITQFNFGNTELKFIADFGFGGLFLFGSILAVVMSVQLFFAEIDNRTALTLLAKPVRRAEFIIGKFIGIWILLAVFITVISIILATMLYIREPEAIIAAQKDGVELPFVNYTGLLIFVLLQWIRVGIVAALTITFTSIAQTYLYAIVISFCALLICQLQYLLADTLEKFGGIIAFLPKLIPNLQLYNIGEALVFSNDKISLSNITSICGSGIIWIICFILISLCFFRNREM